jgi:class 3 adenylate cyclase
MGKVLFHFNLKQNRAYYLRLILIACIILPFFIGQTHAQTTHIKQTENKLKNSYGIDKLKALNELTAYYALNNSKKGLRYAKQAADLTDKLFLGTNQFLDTDISHQIQAFFQYGEMLYKKEKYFDSKAYLDKVLSLSIENENDIYLEDTDRYLKDINARIASGEIKESLFSKTMGNLGVGKAINQTSANLNINTELKIAAANEKNGDYQGAVKHYQKAINLLRNQGDTERITELQLKVAIMLDSMDQHVEAQKLLHNALADVETETNPVTEIPQQDSILQTEQTDSLPSEIEVDALQLEKDSLKALSEKISNEKNVEKSLEYQKKYQQLSAKMEADSLKTAIAQQRKEDEIMLLKQQKEIADLKVKTVEQENEKQSRARKTVFIIALLILMGTLVTFYFYMAKRRQHKKLLLAYSDLDKTYTKLEEAELRIVTLLKQQVSGDIARELLSSKTDNFGEKRFVCIMFLDIRDFTPMAENLSPEELIAFQNKVFGFMLDIIQKYHGNVNQLLGDGFMATFGAPVSHDNDCQNAFFAAQKIIQELDEQNNSGAIETTKIGIGLHAGYVVTGNVGNDARKQYSVTGNPVITASRVEQLNKKHNSRLIITEEVYKKLNKSLNIKANFIDEAVKGRVKKIRILTFD